MRNWRSGRDDARGPAGPLQLRRLPRRRSQLRVYSAGIVPPLDRIVTTTTDMDADFPASRNLQVWRLSDLKLLHTFPLPDGPTRRRRAVLPPSPALLADGKTVLVSTFNCGLYLMEGLDDRDAVRAPGGVVPAEGEDLLRHPGHRRELLPRDRARLECGGKPRHQRPGAAARSRPRHLRCPSDVPALDRDLARPSPRRGHRLRHHGAPRRDRPLRSRHRALSRDERFREEGATEPGFRMDNKTWPHGGNAKGIPHGAVFSSRETSAAR